jgi:outer membrane protein assembly factor BamB
MRPTRRQMLGIAGVALACTAGAGAGAGLGLASRRSAAVRPQGRHEPPRADSPKPLWHLRVPSDVQLTAAGASVYAVSNLKDRLYALRAADGSVRWEMPGEWSTPVTGRGLVYLSPEDGGLSAHSIGSGNKQWASPEASAAPSGPLLNGTVLYTIGGVSGTSVILALDGQTGRKLWAVPAISDASQSTDVPFTVTAGTVYSATGAVIRALDARDGTELWRWAVPGGGLTLSPSPQVAQGIVYGGYSVYNSNESVQFALSARDGSLLWSRTYPTQVLAMAAVDEIVYAAACFGNGGGSFAGPSPTLVSATAIGNGARVWTQNMPQTAQTFTVAGSTALLSVDPTPVAGGIAYPGGAASETELRALGLSNGLTAWSVAGAGWSLAAAPVIAGDWVCAGFTGASIRVVNLHTGATRWNLPMFTVSAPAAHDGVVFAVGADAMNSSGAASPEGILYAVPI